MPNSIIVGGKSVGLCVPLADVTIASRKLGEKYWRRTPVERAVVATISAPTYVGSAVHSSSLNIGTPITIAFKGQTLTLMPYARSDTNQIQLLVVYGSVAQVTGALEGDSGKASEFVKLFKEVQFLRADNSVWQSMNMPSNPATARNYSPISKSVSAAIVQQWYTVPSLVQKIKFIPR